VANNHRFSESALRKTGSMSSRVILVTGHKPTGQRFCIASDGSRRVLVSGQVSALCCRDPPRMGLAQPLPARKSGKSLLLAAPAKHILAYRKFFDDTQVNPATHEGIEVGGEEATIIYYCYRAGSGSTSCRATIEQDSGVRSTISFSPWLWCPSRIMPQLLPKRKGYNISQTLALWGS
jgi:hypothetical protein